MRRHLPHRLVLAVVGFTIATADSRAALAAERYALLVGVNDYEHPKLREPAPLKFAVNDVTELAAVLGKHGYKVVLLTDDTGKRDKKLVPSKANVEKQLGELLRRCQRGDTFLLALAGHGLQFGKDKDAYFCPIDARPFEMETGTLVSLAKVYTELETSFAGAKIVLVDACRNDPTPGRGRGLDADTAPSPPKGVGVLFSCSAGQRAFEHDSLKHGVFFHYVLEGLRKEAADRAGRVTFTGLATYVSDHVPDKVHDLFPDQKPDQAPNIKADLAGKPPVLLNLSEAGIENSIGMKLVYIPPGEFEMGASDADVEKYLRASPGLKRESLASEQPQHRVRISKGFYLGMYEVTQAEYERVTGTNPSAFSPNGTGTFKTRVAGLDTSRFPVERVSWKDAQEFCRKLSANDGERRGGRTYRLPTEAEWEYAGRAGTTSAFHFGDVANGRQANIVGASTWGTTEKGPALQRPTTVGAYPANAFGLYDMHGNVFEWCEDYYDEKFYEKRVSNDPRNNAESPHRVLRGGGWFMGASQSRSTFRLRLSPDTRDTPFGFRLACTVAP